VLRSRLTVVSLVSLFATALLGLAVSRGHDGYHLESGALQLIDRSSSLDSWAALADFLAVPVIALVLIVSLVYGAGRRVLPRVVVLAGFAAAAELVNERIVKPVVQERIHGTTLSFPSGHVTAVCAMAVAMWIALYPVLGGRARTITFLLGAAWTLLMSVAVVGAFWHTPIDAIGSIPLSVGIVTAGAAMLGPGPAPPSTAPVEPIRELEKV
jgi:membrane-associated phospholipid phosphatase